MAENFERLPVLRTKLYRPRTTGDLVRRPRVRELLQCQLDFPLILVSAPAGFGKTTLLSDWLDRCSTPSAWLSLDKGDSDLGVFLSYVVAAIRTLFPLACAETLALAQVSPLPPVERLAAALINDLDDLEDGGGPFGKRDLPSEGDYILVLDDYHLVADQAVHALLGGLLRHPPRGMHLIISTRRDPPLPLHSLRAGGQLGEIRTEDLRFTSGEAASFFELAVATPLGAEVLAAVTERAEGWATGLRLAALTLGAGMDPSDSAARVPDDRYAFDYLLNEVLAHLPHGTQEFLLATSILDRLSGPLCDAVIPPADPAWDGRAYLEWLAGQSLFTVALDAQGTWYRYHHLFQRLLRAQLERRHSPEEIAELQQRASAWFSQNSLIEEAIEHATAVGDELAVVRLIERHRHEAMNEAQWGQLEHWMRLVPRRLIDTRPELLMAEAWILQQQWQYADLLACLDRAEALIVEAPGGGTLPDSDRERLGAEVDALRSWTFYYALQGERASACAARALKSAPLECSTVRGTAWLYYAAGRHMTGDARGANNALLEALKEDRLHGNAFPVRLYSGLCFFYWIDAEFRSLLLVATQLLEVACERDLAEGVAFGHYFRGCALYQMNDLAGAEAEFAAAVSHRYLAHSMAVSQAAFGLAAVHTARGANEQAAEAMDSVAGYALETSNPRIVVDAAAFRALLALQSGSLAEARHWADLSGANTPPAPMTTFHVSLITLAKIQMRGGTPAALVQAAGTLDRLCELATSTNNRLVLIEALALQALLLDEQGDRAAALDCLKQAVALAEPGGAIRVFVDLGPKLAVLLRGLAGRGIAPAYLAQLLTVLNDRSNLLSPRISVPNVAVANTRAANAAQVEPLSQRELDVLGLLGARMTNDEIAGELVISRATVKRHLSNIYQKFGVGSRRAAVAQAASLGILPASQRPVWPSGPPRSTP